jgi:hypothetical protein
MTSKYFSPAIPTFTGLNATLLSLPTVNTPSTSFLPTCFWGWRLPMVGAVSVLAMAESSRTVSAMIGIDSTPVRVSVTTLAVAEKSGRVSAGALMSWIVTS